MSCHTVYASGQLTDWENAGMCGVGSPAVFSISHNNADISGDYFCSSANNFGNAANDHPRFNRMLDRVVDPTQPSGYSNSLQSGGGFVEIKGGAFFSVGTGAWGGSFYDMTTEYYTHPVVSEPDEFNALLSITPFAWTRT